MGNQCRTEVRGGDVAEQPRQRRRPRGICDFEIQLIPSRVRRRGRVAERLPSDGDRCADRDAEAYRKSKIPPCGLRLTLGWDLEFGISQ